MLTGGQVAALIIAVFFAVAVLFLSLALVKLGGVLDETQKLLAGVTDKTVPLLGEVTGTVVHVNDQLVRVDTITENVESITTNAKALTGLFSATLGSPLVKVAAFTYGVRRASTRRDLHEAERLLKAERKARKKKS